MTNLFMTGSIEHRHKKGRLDEADGIPPPPATTRVENDDDDGDGDEVAFHDVQNLARAPPAVASSLLRDHSSASSSNVAAAGGVAHKKKSDEGDVSDTKADDDDDDGRPGPVASSLLRDSSAAAGIGVAHEKKSEERDVGDPAPRPQLPQRAPPAPEPLPLDPAGLRGGDVASDNNPGSLHAKSSTEQNHNDAHHEEAVDEERESNNGIRFHDLDGPGNGLRGDESNAANNIPADTGSYHGKSSFHDQASVPTPKPTPGPTDAVFQSLRDVHQSSNNNGGTTASEHQKVATEQNAQNPDNLPEYWTPPETGGIEGVDYVLISPTGRPTVDLRRVNPAPDNNNGGGGVDDNDEDWKECEATADGRYFGKGQGGDARNAGVVLRYRYELYENGIDASSKGTTDPTNDGASGGGDLTEDVLPRLEGAIADGLIPVFFEECLNHHAGSDDGGRLLLLDRQRKRDTVRGRRRLTEVAGIDAKPRDVPLEEGACESTFVSSDPNIQCHRVEGGLTLYFPPNFPVHSSVLSSATLTTLRAIEQGMNDGSLQLSHPAIRKLHFVKGSYDLDPEEDAGGAALSGVHGGGKDPKMEGGNTSVRFLILGVLLPLLLVGCCFGVCLGLWCKRQRRRRRDRVDEYDEESSRGTLAFSETKGELPRGFDDHSQEDDYTESGTEYPEDESYSGSEFDDEEDQGTEYDYEADRGTEYDDAEGRGTEYDEEGEQGTEYDEELTDSGSEYDEEEDHGSATTQSHDGTFGSGSEYDEEDHGSARTESHEDTFGPSPGEYYHGSAASEDSYDKRFGSRDDDDETESSSSFNPFGSVFEEAEREREKKAKMRRRESRARKRMERMQREREEQEEDAALSSDGESAEGMDRDENSDSSDSEISLVPSHQSSYR